MSKMPQPTFLEIQKDWNRLQSSLTHSKIDKQTQKQLRQFLHQCVEAGKYSPEPIDRANLQWIAREVGDMLFQATYTYPNTVIRPFLSFLSSEKAPATVTNNSNVWNVPHERNAFFTGQEAVLQKLSQNSEALLFHAQAISGLGGIGKTQVVVEYAYRHRKDYQAVFWVRAKTDQEVYASFIEIAQLLNLQEHNAPVPHDAVQAVKHWMETNPGWLLIFDNAERPELIKPFLPNLAQGHILLTSRAQVFDSLGISRPINLKKMTVEEAATFLFKRTGREAGNSSEQAAATAVAAELGYLPLALEQAGAYILEQQVSLENYLKGYRKRRLMLLNQARPVTGNYPDSVATTWALNFQEIEAHAKVAGDLLRVSAFLSPDAIPYEVFERGAEELGEPLAEVFKEMTDDPMVFAEVLAPLARYSLIRTEPNLRVYSIARMVQEVVKDEMDEESCRSWTDRTLRALTQAFPNPRYGNWPQCARILPHARAILGIAHIYKIESEINALLLDRTGYYLNEQAQYNVAEPLLIEALDMRKQLLGNQHLD
ncbi:MAG: tetratricopeptide repeat protein, partial [Parerythrobacter sp.]